MLFSFNYLGLYGLDDSPGFYVMDDYGYMVPLKALPYGFLD